MNNRQVESKKSFRMFQKKKLKEYQKSFEVIKRDRLKKERDHKRILFPPIDDEMHKVNAEIESNLKEFKTIFQEIAEEDFQENKKNSKILEKVFTDLYS